MGREIKREPGRGDERQNHTGHTDRQRPAHLFTTTRLRETKEKENIFTSDTVKQTDKTLHLHWKWRFALYILYSKNAVWLFRCNVSLYCCNVQIFPNKTKKKSVPKGASSAAVLAGAVEMKDRRAHKATMPACAPSAHWEGIGQKPQSLTTAKLQRWH